MSISIEPIAHQHAASFHHVLDLVARERQYLTIVEAPSLEKTKAFVAGFIERADPLFVALSAGEVVGWCDISRRQRTTERHVGSLGMGLLPAFRGQGLGRRLLTTTIQDAHAKGFVRIELTVYDGNDVARRLYESLGFQSEGIARDIAFIDGTFRSATSMALIERGVKREDV